MATIMDAKEMEQSYLKWIKENEKYTDLSEELVRIDTPFLDGTLDNIVLYVDSNNSNITITDDGWTLDYLETHGFTFRNRSHRFNLLQSTLKTFGLDLSDNEILINCTKENFPTAKQRILQGLIKINDLVFLNDTNTINIFKNDVITRLNNNNILYDAPYTVSGKNGYTYSFDLSIPQLGGKKKLVNMITQPNKISFTKLFAVDAKLSSQTVKNADFYAVLNDSKELNNLDEIKYIFSSETDIEITPILMSDKTSFAKLLSNK